MKSVDKTVVGLFATMLMDENGNTTTLEVKNVLRAQGYNACQSDISSFMRDLAVREKWQVEDTGNHKTYTLPDYSSPAAPVATRGTVSELTFPSKGCWEVNSTSLSYVVRYYDSSANRSQVRWAFAKSTGTKFADSRSRKHK